jgi:hypothetical protein
MSGTRYAPPSSNLAVAAPDDRQEFYVVSPGKFSILFLTTAGLYSLYWFYQQWAFNKRYSGSTVYPLFRTLFGFIYVFPLFRKVDRSLRRQEAGHMRAWWLSGLGLLALSMAGTLVVIGSYDDQPVEELTLWTLWADAVMIGNFIIYLMAQRRINVAALDPTDRTNSRLSAANWVWITLGIIFWVMDIASLVALGVS